MAASVSVTMRMPRCVFGAPSYSCAPRLRDFVTWMRPFSWSKSDHPREMTAKRAETFVIKGFLLFFIARDPRLTP